MGNQIEIFGRDGRYYKLNFELSQANQMRQIHTILTKNTFFKKEYGFLKNSFTYKYQIQQFDSETPIDGWNLPFTRGDILNDLVRWNLMDEVGNI
jgi:hypothetical protein